MISSAAATGYGRPPSFLMEWRTVLAAALDVVRSRPWLTVAGVLLAVLSGGQLVESARAVIYPAEINYGEAILYDHAGRLLRGEPLYQPLDQAPYTAAAYTPLFYWLAAAARVIAGDGFWPGRLISLCAGIVAAFCVALLAWRLIGLRTAGAFAAGLFLALGIPWVSGAFAPWSALYKEDMLGVALSLGATTVLAHGTGPRRLVAAGLLAGLAILTKQTLIVAVLAGTLWLLPARGAAALFAGTAAMMVAATATALEMATGAFFANVLLANANPFRLSTLLRNLPALGMFQIGPLVAAGLWAKPGARWHGRPIDRLLLLYWMATLLPLAGLAKVGADSNYWTEAAAVTAVLATAAVWQSGQTNARAAPRSPLTRLNLPLLAILVTPAFVLNLAPLLTGRTAPIVGHSALTVAPGDSAAFASLVERVRHEPRAVLASPADVIALSGRPILLEPYLFSILEQHGHWDARPLVRRICDGDVGLLVLDRPLEGQDLVLHGYAHWPEPVRAALREAMVFEGQQAGRYVYVPRGSGHGTVCQEELG